MKNCLIYGIGIALGTALLTLVLFFLGFHTDPAKLGAAQGIALVGSLIITSVGIVLGTKAERARLPLDADFGYGRALLAGFLISVVAAFFGVVCYLLYIQVINPGFNDVILQAQAAKMELAGRTPEQIEQMEAFSRKWMSPGAQGGISFVMTTLFGTVISLIASAFLRREPVEKFESA